MREKKSFEDRLKGVLPTFETCESSNLVGFAYQEDKKLLYVAFKNEKIYSYYPVTKEEYQRMKAADSKGTYFGKNFRSNKNLDVHCYTLS